MPLFLARSSSHHSCRKYYPTIFGRRLLPQGMVYQRFSVLMHPSLPYSEERVPVQIVNRLEICNSHLSYPNCCRRLKDHTQILPLVVRQLYFQIYNNSHRSYQKYCRAIIDHLLGQPDTTHQLYSVPTHLSLHWHREETLQTWIHNLSELRLGHQFFQTCCLKLNDCQQQSHDLVNSLYLALTPRYRRYQQNQVHI